MGDEVELFDGVEHRKCCCTGDWVAAERGTVVTGAQPLRSVAKGDAGTDGQSPAEAFCEGEHVGQDTVVLMAEPRTAPADPALHLVEHQERSGRIADRSG